MKKSTSPLGRFIQRRNIIKFGQTPATYTINQSSNFVTLGANIISSNVTAQNSFTDDTQNFNRYNYLSDGLLKGKAIILNNHNLTSDQENNKKVYSLGVSTIRNLQQSISSSKIIIKDNSILSIKNSIGIEFPDQIRIAKSMIQERSIKIEDIRENQSGNSNVKDGNIQNSQVRGLL